MRASQKAYGSYSFFQSYIKKFNSQCTPQLHFIAIGSGSFASNAFYPWTAGDHLVVTTYVYLSWHICCNSVSDAVV